MRPIRTDLAMESAQDFGSLPGVRVNTWNTEGVCLTEVVVEDVGSAAVLGKPVGRYLTLESPAMRNRDLDTRMAVSVTLGEEIARLLPENPRCALVAGLGNRNITPDSIGPLTLERVLVTRHIFSQLPEYADERLRSVCAIAPGVLGVTGIETGEMLESLMNAVRPDCVICVDALSARATSRVGTTVQLSDTGIVPGSGVGNRRMTINRETLGVPVLAVGVPTVIYAATLVRDALSGLIGETDGVDRDRVEQALLGDPCAEMIVTPREIDQLAQDCAGILAMGINRALQPEMSNEEILAMMD